MAMGLYGLLHSITASRGLKAWVATKLGESGSRGYRLGFNLFAGLSFIPLLVLMAFLPNKNLYTLSSGWMLLFNLLRGLSLLLLLESARQTGILHFIGLAQLTNREKPSLLQTGGLYRYVRHPIYTFTMSFLIFNPTMSLNSAAFTVAVILYCFVGAMYEEKKLIEEFGQAYIDYRDKTPMLLPVRLKHN